MSIFKAYNTKNIQKKCAMQKHDANDLDILRDYFSIPDELLSSRARLRFLISVTKLKPYLYIYKQS